MKVEVTRANTCFLLDIVHNGGHSREVLPYRSFDDTWWDRKYARIALDMLTALYPVNRRSIRFDHVN